MTVTNSMSRLGIVGLVLAGLSLLMALLTVWQAASNRSQQQTLTANQEKLAKAQALTSLDNNLVQLVAKSVVENNDNDLRSLLQQNGVTLKSSAAPPSKPKGADDGQ